jgi:hypothetical protein
MITVRPQHAGAAQRAAGVRSAGGTAGAIAPLFVEHGRREIKTTGDGVNIAARVEPLADAALLKKVELAPVKRV